MNCQYCVGKNNRQINSEFLLLPPAFKNILSKIFRETLSRRLTAPTALNPFSIPHPSPSVAGGNQKT